MSLCGVTFTTRPAERVGIVGRTGAGKTSLISALFRLTELHSGRILIDTVDISRIGLRQLRSRLGVIPQEAFLFSGTLYENMDPLGEHSESEVWSALERCHLAATIRRLGGIYAPISPTRTFSHGQRQLLALARALLRNAKIICIDEATSSMDEETDRMIQETLHNSFRQSTVFTIAHRVRTIINSDRVMVIGDGTVLEFDTPDSLLRNKESHFCKLAHQDFQ